ncbi:hypothetical protein ACROYT_G034451, partial [Oculina patagonica]
ALQLLDSWLKLNSRLVCFGAKNGQFGGFSVPRGGNIIAIKLVHRSGYVSCSTSSVHHYSFWGCGIDFDNYLRKFVNVVITTSNNEVILPLSQFITNTHVHTAGKWAVIPGYNSMSPEIVLPFFS